jgi:hypothetical protein
MHVFGAGTEAICRLQSDSFVSGEFNWVSFRHLRFLTVSLTTGLRENGHRMRW